jgi:hypothetical protein
LRYDPYSEPPRGEFISPIPEYLSEVDEFDAFDQSDVGDWVDGNKVDAQQVEAEPIELSEDEPPVDEEEVVEEEVVEEEVVEEEVVEDDDATGEDEAGEEEEEEEAIDSSPWRRTSSWITSSGSSGSSGWQDRPVRDQAWRDSAVGAKQRVANHDSTTVRDQAWRDSAIGAKQRVANHDSTTWRGVIPKASKSAAGAVQPPASGEHANKEKKKPWQATRGTKSRAGRKVQAHRAGLASSPEVALAVARMMRSGRVEVADEKMLHQAFGGPAIAAMLAAAAVE